MTTQLKALQQAIKNCGSLSELSRRTGKKRQFIYKLLHRAKQIAPTKDLCKADFALLVDLKSGICWKDLCPYTACLYDIAKRPGIEDNDK